MEGDGESATALGQASGGLPQGSGTGLTADACAPHAVPPGVSVLRKDRTVPRERVDHSRIVYVVPPDFPRRLEQLGLVSDRRSHFDARGCALRAPRYSPPVSQWESR